MADIDDIPISDDDDSELDADSMSNREFDEIAFDVDNPLMSDYEFLGEETREIDGEEVLLIVPDAIANEDIFVAESDNLDVEEIEEIDNDSTAVAETIEDYDNTAVIPTIGAVTAGERVMVVLKNGIPTAMGSTGFGDDINLRVHEIEADYIKTEVIEAERARVNNLLANKADVSSLTAEQVRVDNLLAGKASVDDLNAATGRIGALEADHVSTDDLEAEQVRVNNLLAGKASISDLTAEQARVNNLLADKADISTLEAEYAHVTNGTIDNAKINHADVTGLNAEVASIADARIGQATIRQAQVENLSADYAKITNGKINSALIDVAAIVDEQVFTVTGNKATIEEINADTITVRNLHTANLVVDSAEGYVTIGNKKTPTKEALDALVGTLQNEIDGAVETFTSSAVPLLTNYPASDWQVSGATAEEQRKAYAKHVGDICYVQNSASDQNGYAYRFTYDSTEQAFKWVLIKDSDVTKALGDISDLQTFESETNTWIEETDEGLRTIRENHTSLSGIVDKTLVSSTQLWFSKANTTAPNKPTAQVTSTATSGNAWTTAVPAYNASYPNYFYCYQWKYADGAFGWSAVTLDIAMGESQAQGRKGVSDAAAAQNTANANIKSSVQLWFTKATNAAPAKPTSVISTNNAATGNAWNLAVPTYNASYPHYFYCYQQQKGDDAYQWTDVVYDRATTENQAVARAALPSSTFETFKTTTFKEVVDTVGEQSTAITTLSEKTSTLANPNLTPWFSAQTSVYWNTLLDANDDYATGHKHSESAEGLKDITYLNDGWMHAILDSRASAGNENKSCYINTWVNRNQLDKITPGGTYTWLIEVRNLNISKSTLRVRPSIGNDTLDIFSAVPVNTTDSGCEFSEDGVKRIQVTAKSDLSNVTHGTCGYIYVITDVYVEADVRVSLYEGEYSGPYKPYVDQTLISRVSTAETKIEQNSEAITLRATKTEAQRMAHPNLSPWFSLQPIENDAEHWRIVSGDATFTPLEDGWVHLHNDNSSGTNDKRTDYQVMGSPSITPGADYTWLFEYRNNNSTGNNRAYIVQSSERVQFWGNNVVKVLEGKGSDGSTDLGPNQDFPPGTDGVYVKRVLKKAEEATSSHLDKTGTLYLGCLVCYAYAGSIADYDLRVSIYEGEYTGPYKPYSGTQLYASQAQLKVANDEIALRVEKSGVISSINQSAEAIKIKADKVQIDGTAVFSAIKDQADAGYDAKGAASAVQTNLDNLAIGGRNYILNSASISASGIGSASGSGKEYLPVNVGQSYMDIAAGTEVVISFDLYMTVNRANPVLQVYNTDNKGPKAFSSVETGAGSSPGVLLRFTAEVGDVIDERISVVGYINDRNSPTLTYNFLEFYSDYGSSNWFSVSNLKMEIGNRPTDWSPAPEDIEASAINRSQRIYYRATSASEKPAANTTWLAASGTGYKNWSLSIPPLKSGDTKYPFLYTAVQTQTVAQQVAGTKCSCTPVLIDETTTVIDGATIITGSIHSNSLDANSVKADIVQTTDLNASKITSGDIATARMSANIVKAVQAKVSDLYALVAKIGGFVINATSIFSGAGVTSNADNSIALSTEDFTRTINSTSRAGLRFAIGDKFGVTGDGTLYAHGANIVGINADNINSGSIGVDRIKANVISAVNNGTGTINADKINVSAIKIGDLSGSIGGRNLYAMSNAVTGYIGTSSPMGDIILTPSNPQHSTSDFIPVSEGDVFTFQMWNPNLVNNTGNSNRMVCWYDSSKAYISVQNGEGDSEGSRPRGKAYWSFTCDPAPANAAYARFGFIIGPSTNAIDPDIKVKVERGDRPTDWSPAPEDQAAYVDNSIDGIAVGGANLLLHSNDRTKWPINQSASYQLARVALSENLVMGDTYTMQIWGTVGRSDKSGTAVFNVCWGGGSVALGTLTPNSARDYWTLTFKAPTGAHNDKNNSYIHIYNTVPVGASGTTYSSNIIKAKLERGNKPTDWSPAPEDISQMVKINTAVRNFTTAQWKSFGAVGHVENWTTGSSYNNSHIHVGDTAYITGTVTNGVKGTATIIGTVTAINGSTTVTMSSTQLIFGGDSVDAASKTAISYLTDITGGGVKVHPSTSDTTGVWITNDVDIMRNGTSVAMFGTDQNSQAISRIGYEDSGHTEQTSDTFTIYADHPTEGLSVAAEISTGSEEVDGTTYRTNKLNFSTPNGPAYLETIERSSLGSQLKLWIDDTINTWPSLLLGLSTVISNQTRTARIEFVVEDEGPTELNLYADSVNLPANSIRSIEIESLAASKITGTLAAARIPNLNASKITDGTLNTARLPTVPIDKGGTGDTGVEKVTAQATIFSSVASGMTISNLTCATWGKMCMLSFTVHPSSAQTSAFTIGTLATAYRPVAVCTANPYHSSVATARILTNGTIQMTAAPSNDIPVSFTYLLMNDTIM